MFQAKHFKVLPIKTSITTSLHNCKPVQILKKTKKQTKKQKPNKTQKTKTQQKKKKQTTKNPKNLLWGVTTQAVLIAAVWEFKSLREELRKSCNCWHTSHEGNFRWPEQGLT